MIILNTNVLFIKVDYLNLHMLKKKLYDFIIFNRKLGNPVTSTKVYNKFLQINPEEIKTDKETLLKRIYRFMKRNNLSIRRPTHVGRLIYNNIYLEVEKFINELTRLIINFKFTKDIIGNMGETPFKFNMLP